ncbi:type III-B CRISPR module RAMP protein Cmr6 [Thermodesulfovibrio sp. 3462-1]|uniref:Type III-B CRISPR module RAMP protein Cmr6 n=1 Tax=Thermodesulfovibrio obliviosus TaxID=3118332 RepID=A0AAU8H2Y0_9BACT
MRNKERRIIEKYSKDYLFYTSKDTQRILGSIISKIRIERFDERKKKWEKKDWVYDASSDFVKNPSLIFGKFIPESLVDGEEKENKDKYLYLVIKEFERIKNDYVPTLLKRIKKTIKEDFEKNGFVIQDFSLALSWRLVIGLGASHPQETSMTLHHIYGIPYIPGSAIKGVTRHWAVLRFAEELAKKNNLGIEKAIEEVSKKLENGDESLSLFLDTISFQDLIKIFGTQKEEGKVIFFDAYPDENIELKIDIMNPHYPDYYGGDKPPTDWQNPVPIKFLTIEKTKFQFYLASRDKDLLTKAENLLKDALKNFGIGAKTSLGYGVFEEV